MTHLEHVIRDVKMFIPKPSKNKKLKARVLSKLYAEEAKERRSSKHRTKRITIKPRQQYQKISFGISDFLRKRSEKRRTLKQVEFRINQQKENAGYVHIDPKQTHKQAIAEIEHGVKFVPKGQSSVSV